MEAVFLRMKEKVNTESVPDGSVRKTHLKTLRRLVTDHAREIKDAIAADFGVRCDEETELCEILQTLTQIDFLMSHVKSWIKLARVRTPVSFWPASSFLVSQPRGVVGIVSPWNYPLVLTLVPLAEALAAGNRVMIKVSEKCPNFSQLIKNLIEKSFDADWIHVVCGDAKVARDFVRLPFDYLLYTGNGRVARDVMRAAAEHLTPVTLELGGKSPAVITPEAAFTAAIERILVGKCVNAGQTCIAPDTVYVPRAQIEDFVRESKRLFATLYPDPKTLTSVINDLHAKRLETMLEDAKYHNARIVALAEGDSCETRQYVPRLVIDPEPGARILEDEIFGPWLLVKTYGDLDAVVARLKSFKERPLALYWFDTERSRIRRIVSEIACGGVCVNDTLLHFAQNRLPFGGVGESGMGAYHAKAGFDAMSHKVPVFEQSSMSVFPWFNPPYSKFAKLVLKFLCR